MPTSHAPLDRSAFSLSRCPKIRSRRTQPLKVGRQENVGNAGAGMRHEFPSKLRDQREVFVQAPRDRRGGLVVAGINGGEEEPEQRAADRLQGSVTPAPSSSRMCRYSPRAATAWSPAPRASRQSGAPARAAKLHPVKPEALCHSPLRKPSGDCEINLRSRRVIADRAAQPGGPLHRGILMRSWRLYGEPELRRRTTRAASLLDASGSKRI